ncbi:MAG TPA: glycosyltransferase [bacterium]|nr:glycosyltransferase [bacterium]
MISIVVPTLSERRGPPELVRRIADALRSLAPWEILFVDDSDRGSEAARDLKRLADGVRVRYLRGPGAGLAAAVVEGLRRSRGDTCVVMDADLQHPPELVPALLAALERGRQAAVGSRFTAGGGDRLTTLRQLNAWGARLLARLVLTEARRTTDPMSGFFAVRKADVPVDALAPRGWKILLEILVRGNLQRVADVPYAFGDRVGDRSKLTWRTQVAFLRHLLTLYGASAPSRRLVCFALSGFGGVALNMLVYVLLVARWGWQPLPAGLVSRHVPMIVNFVPAQWWTWSDRAGGSAWRRLGRFLAVSEFGTAVNLALIAAFQHLGWRIVPWDNLAGILAAFVCVYLLHDRWTFASPEWAPGSPIGEPMSSERVHQA